MPCGMDQLLRDKFEKIGCPQTIHELLSNLPPHHEPSEVEDCLMNMVKQGEVVTKRVLSYSQKEEEESGGSKVDQSCESSSCTLYWIVTSKQQATSDLPTLSKPSALLDTPGGRCSGIGAPSQKSRQPFKSPAQISDGKLFTTPTPSSAVRHTPCSSRTLQSGWGVHYQEQPTCDVLELKKRLKEVEGEIAELAAAGYLEEELQTHIDALHEYNEMKDTGQLLLGKIAELEGTTTTSLYERFGLELDN